MTTQETWVIEYRPNEADRPAALEEFSWRSTAQVAEREVSVVLALYRTRTPALEYRAVKVTTTREVLDL